MKSKLNFWSYFTILLGAFLAIIMIGFILLATKGSEPAEGLKGFLLAAVLSFTLIWIFWGECRTKMIKVTLSGDILTVRRFFGLGNTRTYLLNSFDGFKISSQPYGGRGNLEYLYLMNGNKKTIKLSEVYHKNYKDLKLVIQAKVKDLGYEPFSFLDEFKEIFL
jgi:hypothetical protein